MVSRLRRCAWIPALLCALCGSARATLMSYWPLDDGPGSGTTANTVAGMPTGTLVNMDVNAAWVTGHNGSGYALNFDGSNDWVDLGTNATLNAVNNPLTASAWVRTTAAGDWFRCIFAKFGNTPFWGLGWMGNSYLGFVVRGSSPVAGDFRPDGPQNWGRDGQWHFLLGMRGNGKVTFFGDGEVLDTRADNGTSTVNTATLRLGSHNATLSPQRDKAACAVVVRQNGQAPTLRIHILSPAGNGDKVAWEAACVQGVVDLCWMPDGRSVLVAADRVGSSGLFRVPADGGRAQAMAGGLAEVRDPAASPDGQRVAFVGRGKPGEPWSLYVASADGASRKVAVPAVFREHRVGYGPAWSPRGDLLAYVAERYLCPGRTEILLWDTSGGGSRPLARTLAGGCIAPAWSPRGDSIAFVSMPLGVGPDGPGTGGLPADILVMDTAGKGTLTVTADGLANLMPSWSPDGRFLAFGTCGEPGYEPHVVQLASVETGKVSLADGGPEAEFLLALARHGRSGLPAPGRLAGLASRMTDREMLAFAAPVLAGLFARAGDLANAVAWARRAGVRPGAGALAGFDALRAALAAYRKAAVGGPKGGDAARAAVEAAKLAALDGDHWRAARLLLDTLMSQAPAGARREALRLLTVGRLQRQDPLAYDVAEVVQLAAFGFLEAAIAQGERLRQATAGHLDGRAMLRRALAEAFEGLAAYHLARGDVAAARQTLGRWIRSASRADDLPKALAYLAASYRQAGEERSLVEVLSHLAAEFPDRPEGAQARRELLLLDTRRQPAE